MDQTIAITGATIFGINEGAIKIWSPGTIWVRGNRIIDIQEGCINAQNHDTKECKIIDASNWIVLPGFINTHLHSHQTPLRSVPGIQNTMIDHWTNQVGLMQSLMSTEEYELCTMGALVELMLSGVTTSADMLYMFGNNADRILESTVSGAKKSGIRYHLVRSGMTNSEENKKAGIDDSLLESKEAMLAGFKHAATEYHDASHDAMLQVAIGPCSIFDFSIEELKQASDIAQEFDLHVNMHFMECMVESDYLKQLSLTPSEFLTQSQLATNNLFLVHCIYLTNDDIQFIADHNIKVASCPTSNARGEGIAPITELLSHGVNVGVGVDGFASNDSGNFLSELKLFRILQGARQGQTYLNWKDTFTCATVGGASVLGRPNLGKIEKGALADLVAFDLTGSLPHAGHHHPVMSLFSCTPIKPAWVMINGNVTIENGHHKSIDVPALAQEIQLISDFIRKKYVF